MSQSLRDLFKFLAITGLAIFLLDYGIGGLLGYAYDRMIVGERARANYAIKLSEADVYIFGASRAVYHYVPRIIEDSTGLTVYNAGRPAQTMLYHYALLKMILKRHVPKIVILDINQHEFIGGEGRYDLIYSLLPYYNADETVRELIDLINPGFRYFSWSHILPYNSSIFAILYRGLISKGGRADNQGYVGLVGHRLTELEHLHNCGKEVKNDTLIVNTFRRFVKLCQANNVKLFAVTSPYFSVPDCPRTDYAFVKEELLNEGITHLDLVDDPKYLRNLNYMYDVGHLNRLGAEEFSREFASWLNKVR